MTLWYKVGSDRVLLLAGQLAGMLTFVLVYLQIILACRTFLLEKLFKKGTLLRLHRVNGKIIAIMACLHIVLILVPEGLTNLPLGRKHWPEMIGLVLLLILIFMVLTAHYQKILPLSYKAWKKLHALAGYSVPVLLFVHIFFVSDSFDQTIPRVFLSLCLLFLCIWIALAKLPKKKI